MNRTRLIFVAAVAVVCLFIVLVVVVLRFVGRRGAPGPTPTGGPPVAAKPGRVLPGAPGPLPALSAKPQPVEINFQGCPAEGDSPRQAELNRLENRVDEGEYVPVTFDSIAGLAWPQSVERLPRDQWLAAGEATGGRYEGHARADVGDPAGG